MRKGKQRKSGPGKQKPARAEEDPVTLGIRRSPRRFEQAPQPRVIREQSTVSPEQQKTRSEGGKAGESVSKEEDPGEQPGDTGEKAAEADVSEDEPEARLWEPPSSENTEALPQSSIQEEEADQRMMTVDEWRSEMFQIKLREQEARQSAKRSERRRAIAQRAALSREEQEERASTMDEWRSDWNRLKEQHEDAKTSLMVHESSQNRRRTEEKLRRLQEALARSFYEALNLQPGASITAIRAAGRRTALECHPDKCPGNEALATDVFKAVRQAQEALEDKAKRKSYDAQRAAPRREGAEANGAGGEPRFQEGSIPVYTLVGRMGGNPWSLELEELQIRQQRTFLGIYENPTRLGDCWVLTPDFGIARAHFRGYLFAQGRAYAAIVQIEGDTVAVSLELNGRVFATEAAARRVQAALLRR
jgi:hypothetical protein